MIRIPPRVRVPRACRAALVVLAIAGGACGGGGVDVDPPPARARLSLVGGDDQTARLAAAPLPTRLTVAATDAATGRPRADAPIVWSTSDGTIDGSARTDAVGQARATWRLAPRLGEQVAVARTEVGDSVVFRARLLASDVHLDDDTLVLRAAEQGRLRWQFLDDAGLPLAGGTIRWSTADGTVATVGDDGIVAALADGTTDVVADAQALGVARLLRATIVVGAPLAGRVDLLDGETPVGLRVYIRTATGTDSADVAPDGSFALRARSAALREATDVLVDAAVGSERRYFPALWRYEPGASAAPLRFLLLPRHWRPAAGPYRGQDVALSLHAALGAGIAPPAEGAPWYDRNGFFERVAPLGVAPTLEAFPESAFPLPIYFDRERSNYPITVDDSLGFWRAVDAMNVALGATLFRPAEKRVAGTHSIGVVVDSVRYDGLASSAWTTTCPASAATPASMAPCAGVLDRVDATLYFSGRTRRVRERDLVQHELGHVLGLGHTCYWQSVMFGQLNAASWASVAPSCARFYQDGAWPGGSIDHTPELTLRDVAHLALYLRTAAAVRRLGAVHNLHAAALGERRVLLGLD